MLGKKTLALFVGSTLIFTIAPQVQAQEVQSNLVTQVTAVKKTTPDVNVPSPEKVEKQLTELTKVKPPEIKDKKVKNAFDRENKTNIHRIESVFDHLSGLVSASQNKNPVNKKKPAKAVAQSKHVGGDYTSAPLAVSKIRYGKTKQRVLNPMQFHVYALKAMELNGITNPVAQAQWEAMLFAVAIRESGLNTHVANGWDSNAFGTIQKDGYPQNSSRGLMQVIPPVFAQNHVFGSDYNIYDPVSNLAASIHYMKTRYNLKNDGSGVLPFLAAHGINGVGY